MSKSRGNGVDIDALLDRHGADAVRLAAVADAPVQRDVTHDPARIAAKAGFLQRMERHLQRLEPRSPGAAADWPDAARIRDVYGAIAAMDDQLAAGRPHLAVARLHVLGRHLASIVAGARGAEGAAHALIRDILRAAWPLIPGWVEARWPDAYGEIQTWPEAPALAADPRPIVVQVDGRTATTIAAGGDVADRARRAVAARLDGRTIQRVIQVPDRLINFVCAPAG